MELLTVIGLILLLASLSVVAFHRINQSRIVTKAGSDLESAVEAVRTQAMSRNTYGWVTLEQQEDRLTLSGALSRNRSGVWAAADPLVFLTPRHAANIRVVAVESAFGRPEAEEEAQLVLEPGDTVRLRFTPRGEMNVEGKSRMKIVEVGLQQVINGVVRDPHDYAVLQLRGLTGAGTLYRP